jgi:hypothetical protein
VPQTLATVDRAKEAIGAVRGTAGAAVTFVQENPGKVAAVVAVTVTVTVVAWPYVNKGWTAVSKVSHMPP